MTHPDYPAIDTEGRITPASKWMSGIFVFLLPTLGVITAGWMAARGLVTRLDLLIFAGMYLATGFGVTVGYHRLFTHRAFEAPWPIRWMLALMGGMAAEGAPIIWASQHRQHHAFSDVDGDPHSPVLSKSLWHAHYGHVFRQVARIDPDRYAPDLIRDPFLRWLEKWAALPVVLGFLIPAALGYAFTRSWQGAATGALWGGLVRLFVITHATGAVNSLCHFFGSRPFDTGDESGNVWWLVLPTLGESWHRNHHAFPTSARHGLFWWQLDPSWMAIWAMEKLGLIRNVVRIDKGHVALKAVVAKAKMAA